MESFDPRPFYTLAWQLHRLPSVTHPIKRTWKYALGARLPIDLYLSNLLPLFLRLCLFLAIVSFAVVCIPGYLNSGNADFVCRVSTWLDHLPLFSLFAFFAGMLFGVYIFLFKLGDWIFWNDLVFMRMISWEFFDYIKKIPELAPKVII